MSVVIVDVSALTERHLGRPIALAAAHKHDPFQPDNRGREPREVTGTLTRISRYLHEGRAHVTLYIDEGSYHPVSERATVGLSS